MNENDVNGNSTSLWQISSLLDIRKGLDYIYKDDWTIQCLLIETVTIYLVVGMKICLHEGSSSQHAVYTVHKGYEYTGTEKSLHWYLEA